VPSVLAKHLKLALPELRAGLNRLVEAGLAACAGPDLYRTGTLGLPSS
jgi:hypothetical protein